MFSASKPLGLAAVLIAASAALHILTPLMGGLGSETLMLVPIGLLYAAIAYLLPPNRRWLAWIAFFIMLTGGIVSLAVTAGTGALPQGWRVLIMIADWGAAAMLFAYLWRPKPAAA